MRQLNGKHHVRISRRKEKETQQIYSVLYEIRKLRCRRKNIVSFNVYFSCDCKRYSVCWHWWWLDRSFNWIADVTITPLYAVRRKMKTVKTSWVQNNCFKLALTQPLNHYDLKYLMVLRISNGDTDDLTSNDKWRRHNFMLYTTFCVRYFSILLSYVRRVAFSWNGKLIFIRFKREMPITFQKWHWKKIYETSRSNFCFLLILNCIFPFASIKFILCLFVILKPLFSLSMIELLNCV